MKKSSISLVSMLAGALVSAGAVEKFERGRLRKTEEMSEKHLALFQMMNQWVKIKQDGKNLSLYFIKNNYREIAVYGMSYAGETLVNELKNTEVKVKYGIDKKADYIYTDIGIISLTESLEEVDAVVVTAITFFDEIEKKLSEKLDCPIISLEDILYEV